MVLLDGKIVASLETGGSDVSRESGDSRQRGWMKISMSLETRDSGVCVTVGLCTGGY